MANPAILWPYLFGAQPVLRVTCNAVTEDLTLGTGSSPLTLPEILTLLDTALEGHSEGPTVTVSITAAWKVQIVSDIALTLLWSHGNTTLAPAVLGWTSSDTASATTLTSPNQAGGLWRPGKPLAEDSGDVPPTVGGTATSLSGIGRTSVFARPYATRDVAWELLQPAVAQDRYADSAAPEGTAENAWTTSLTYGYTFRFCPDEDDLNTYTAYTLREPDTYPIARDPQFAEQRWAVRLGMRRTS